MPRRHKQTGEAMGSSRLEPRIGGRAGKGTILPRCEDATMPDLLYEKREHYAIFTMNRPAAAQRPQRQPAQRADGGARRLLGRPADAGRHRHRRRTRVQRRLGSRGGARADLRRPQLGSGRHRRRRREHDEPLRFEPEAVHRGHQRPRCRGRLRERARLRHPHHVLRGVCRPLRGEARRVSRSRAGPPAAPDRALRRKPAALDRRARLRSPGAAVGHCDRGAPA